MKTFEEHLREVHAQVYQGTDDDMPEDFEYFLSRLDTEDLLRQADLYGREMYLMGQQAMLSAMS